MAHIQSVLDESLAMVGATRGHVRKTGKRAVAELPRTAGSGVEVEVLPSPQVSLPQIDGAKSTPMHPQPTKPSPAASLKSSSRGSRATLPAA